MHSFVALDFETANGHRESACSLGMVRFSAEGEQLGEYYSLIQPPREYGDFWAQNVRIHGIHVEDVAHSPLWTDIIEDVREFVADDPIVAHNMPFDGSVINHLTSYFGLAEWANPRHCTLKLARNLLSGQLDSFGLEPVYDHYYADEEFDHHNALADAVVCGKVYAKFLDEFGADAVEDIMANGSRSASATRSPRSQRPRIDRRKAYAMPYISPKGQFLRGSRVAITGTLSYGSRGQVEALICSLGGEVSAAVTTKTNILLVGPNRADGSSAKVRKALDLQHSGVSISIMNEDEFMRALREVSREFA
ncbi:exonuclease domain-containing protein [Alloscardovia macacae]|uniref:DNA polymerase III subunit epsilon n=1 Tax=Alloscardovia macacae TaxID=1160091 RepID=A0A261F5N8_9BIFI|nr:exonuclease domain-containing protein [Alloscardovia macacae]OZG54216.1 DNA polymerase III subunit epsilon [Alloscardovia macacae]